MGTWTTGTPRNQVAAAKPTRSVVAPHAHLPEPLPERVQGGTGLGVLPTGDGDPLDRQPRAAQPVLVQSGTGVQLGGVDERYAPGAPANGPGDAAHDLVDQILADHDLVGRRGRHRQAQSPVGSDAPGGQRTRRGHGGVVVGRARPRRTGAPTGAGGRGGQPRQRPGGVRRLGPQAHQDERRHLLGSQAIGGHGQGGDLGVQGRTPGVEGLHARQDRIASARSPTIRARCPSLSAQRILGRIGVRLGSHQRPARAVADVRGGGLGGRGQMHHRATAEQGAVLVAQDGASTQRHHALGRRRGVENGAQRARLPHPEGLLPLLGEDLGHGHAGASTNLRVGVGDLQPEGRGEQPCHGGLARTGQAHQNQRKVLRIERDMGNGTAAHRSPPRHWVRSAIRAR